MIMLEIFIMGMIVGILLCTLLVHVRNREGGSKNG